MNENIRKRKEIGIKKELNVKKMSTKEKKKKKRNYAAIKKKGWEKQTKNKEIKFEWRCR